MLSSYQIVIIIIPPWCPCFVTWGRWAMCLLKFRFRFFIFFPLSNVNYQINIKTTITFQIDVIQTSRHSVSPSRHSHEQPVFINLQAHGNIVLWDENLGFYGLGPCRWTGELVVYLVPFVDDVELIHAAAEVDQV